MEIHLSAEKIISYEITKHSITETVQVIIPEKSQPAQTKSSSANTAACRMNILTEILHQLRQDGSKLQFFSYAIYES